MKAMSCSSGSMSECFRSVSVSIISWHQVHLLYASLAPLSPPWTNLVPLKLVPARVQSQRCSNVRPASDCKACSSFPACRGWCCSLVHIYIPGPCLGLWTAFLTPVLLAKTHNHFY